MILKKEREERFVIWLRSAEAMRVWKTIEEEWFEVFYRRKKAETMTCLGYTRLNESELL